MIRLITISAASIVAVLMTSCGCCTSDSVAPKLRPLPQFREIEAAPTSDPAPSPVVIDKTK